MFFYFNIHTNFRVCLPSSVEFQLGLLLAVCASICLSVSAIQRVEHALFFFFALLLVEDGRKDPNSTISGTPSLNYHLSLRSFLSIFEWPLKTGFTVTKKNPILAMSGCTHMRICVHVGTPQQAL